MTVQPDALAREAGVLIIDDEAANVRFLEDALRPAGYHRIVGTTDPREAEKLFREWSPDLVLLDLVMPHLDGVELVERLRRQLEPDDFVPFVILSADSTPASVRRALSAGAHDYLTKPLRVHEIRLRIRNLLEMRRLHLELRRQNCALEDRVAERTRALRQQTLELEDARAEILARLGRAAEYRDDQTGEHTARVGRLAVLLGTEIGLPPEDIEMLERLAPLHDVGKIGIPDDILLRPGVLAPDDFERMQEHTRIGAELLGGSRHAILTRAEGIALSHHEHWDGSGYPHGLAAEEIPLDARIVAVADVFDSLTHPRPYKPAWTALETIEYVEQQSGRQFDPEVATALVRLYRAGALAAFTRPDAVEAKLRLSGEPAPSSDAPGRTAAEHIALLEQERARLARRVERLERALEEQGRGGSAA